MSMYFEGRRNSIALMCVLWVAIPLCTAYLFVNGLGNSSILIALIVSAAFNTMGIAIYAGNYRIISGFSTMTLEEINKYNIETITVWTGISCCIAGYLFFIADMIVSIQVNEMMGLIVGAILCIIALSLWAIIISVDKRFRNYNYGE